MSTSRPSPRGEQPAYVPEVLEAAQALEHALQAVSRAWYELAAVALIDTARGSRDAGSIETPAPDAARRSEPGGDANGNRFPRFERHARPGNRIA